MVQASRHFLSAFLFFVLLPFIGAINGAHARDKTDANGLLAAPTISTATASPNAEALAVALDTMLDKAIYQNRVVGAVLLVFQDGQIIYQQAFGFSDREGKVPMRKDSIFRLSSVSKPLTVMAAAALIRQGKLQLDDPVTKWLPDFTPALPNGEKPVITIKQLMSHTSGLTYTFFEKPDGPYHRAGVLDGLENPNGVTLDENLRRIASAPLKFEPGSAWQYSLSTDVLGAVVAKANGTTLPEAMQSLVTGPLGMKDTGFMVTDKYRLTVPYYNASAAEQNQPAPPPTAKASSSRKRHPTKADVALGPGNVAQSEFATQLNLLQPNPPPPIRMGTDEYLVLHGGKIHFTPGRVMDPNAYPSGGAGMVGTAKDFMSLLEAIRKGGEPITNPELMAMMNTNQIGHHRAMPGFGFGLGWAVLVDPAAAKTPQSAGTLAWGGVYGHSWFIDPAKKLSVILMTDTAFEGMDGQLVTDVRDTIYSNLPQ